MEKSKRAIYSDLAKLDATTDEDIARQIAEDPDTAPELTDEELDAAELYEGDKFIRRVGRPKGSGKKEQVTLRLDRDILERFRAGGPGWQTRLNETLRSAAREPKSDHRGRIGRKPRTARAGRTPRSLANVVTLVRKAVRGTAQASIEELQAYLRLQHGVAISLSRLRTALRSAGVKVRSRTARPRYRAQPVARARERRRMLG